MFFFFFSLVPLFWTCPLFVLFYSLSLCLVLQKFL